MEFDAQIYPHHLYLYNHYSSRNIIPNINLSEQGGADLINYMIKI